VLPEWYRLTASDLDCFAAGRGLLSDIKLADPPLREPQVVLPLRVA
jgi:hypothetical protein